MKNLLIAGALAAVGCANYMKVEVEGRVVDESGRPVAGAQVTTSPWQPVGLSSVQSRYAVTDRNGLFSATLPRSSSPGQAIFASLPGDPRGGQVVIPADKASGLQIVLLPMTTVRADFDDSKVPSDFRYGSPPVSAVTGGPSTAVVASRFGKPTGTRSVSFRLPPGSYQLHAYGGGKPLIHAFEVRHGEEEVDLGTLAVEPYQYQTLIGRPAPDLHIADARGVPKDFKLSSLRGKWVALFFWNHRMEANGHILPAYAELYETRKDARDRFEIIVVHNSDDVLTVGDYDRAVWRKEIPKFSMPLVIDDREKSFETYGLERGPQFRTAPSEFLVDPEGNVAAYGFDVFWKLLEVFGRKKSAER